MKVAAVQFAPVFKQFNENQQVAAYLVTQAAQAGAKLVVLPELCTTGYSFMSRDDAAPYAEDISDYPNSWSKSNAPGMMFAMGELVAKYGIAVAWGMITVSNPRDKFSEHRLHNSQVLMYPGGFKTYNKINFYGNDYLWATPGTESPPIVTWNGKKIGLLICADVRDKSDDIEDFYEPGDADIVAFSANFGKGAFPSRSWVKFAKDNKTTFVVSNRYGEEVHNDFGFGGPCIVDPDGTVHCDGLKWNEPCIVYADIT